MGKVIAGIVAIVLIAGGWMYFTDTDIEGGELPSVDVDGGELPDVEVRGPEVTTGTKAVTIEVPTVEIDAPEDDADGEENEIIDDEGVNTPEVDVDVEVDDGEDPEQ
jgi:hypothetical protein